MIRKRPNQYALAADMLLFWVCASLDMARGRYPHCCPYRLAVGDGVDTTASRSHRRASPGLCLHALPTLSLPRGRASVRRLSMTAVFFCPRSSHHPIPAGPASVERVRSVAVQASTLWHSPTKIAGPAQSVAPTPKPFFPSLLDPPNLRAGFPFLQDDGRVGRRGHALSLLSFLFRTRRKWEAKEAIGSSSCNIRHPPPTAARTGIL